MKYLVTASSHAFFSSAYQSYIIDQLQLPIVHLCLYTYLHAYIPIPYS